MTGNDVLSLILEICLDIVDIQFKLDICASCNHFRDIRHVLDTEVRIVMRRKILLRTISSQSRNDTLIRICVLHNLVESLAETIGEDVSGFYSGSTDIDVSSSDYEIHIPLLVHKRKSLPTGL